MINATEDSEASVDLRGRGALGARFRRVFVVVDDPALLRLLSKILESAGFKVQQAEDGLQAIEAIRNDPPDFVITDWDMPVINGIKLCEMLRRESLPHYVYIVLLTARSQTQDMIRGVAAGADDFSSKPVIAGELLARLQAGARVLELEHRLSVLARYDPLTELLNRRTFFEIIEKEWSRSVRHGYPLSCVMIDVDFFKRINDTYGHLAGDAVLKAISSRLDNCCRKNDCVCRYGGEEFCVLLPDTDEQGAVHWAERCRQEIAQRPCLANQQSIQLTISLGVAQRCDDTQNPERLLDLADQSLLAAKRGGRNRVVVFGSHEQLQGSLP